MLRALLKWDTRGPWSFQHKDCPDGLSKLPDVITTANWLLWVDFKQNNYGLNYSDSHYPIFLQPHGPILKSVTPKKTFPKTPTYACLPADSNVIRTSLCVDSHPIHWENFYWISESGCTEHATRKHVRVLKRTGLVGLIHVVNSA